MGGPRRECTRSGATRGGHVCPTPAQPTSSPPRTVSSSSSQSAAPCRRHRRGGVGSRRCRRRGTRPDPGRRTWSPRRQRYIVSERFIAGEIFETACRAADVVPLRCGVTLPAMIAPEGGPHPRSEPAVAQPPGVVLLVFIALKGVNCCASQPPAAGGARPSNYS